MISVPLSVVWVATSPRLNNGKNRFNGVKIAGCLLRNKKEWVYSCYDKLAEDLVFDNGRMMETGFAPVHSIETIMGNERTDDSLRERDECLRQG